MPAPKKGLTWAFPARFNDQERDMIRQLVTEYAEHDIKISLNDAVRIMIRRAANPPPMTYELASARGAHHCTTCPHCTPTQIRCPDGQRIRQMIVALSPDRTPKAPAPARPTPAPKAVPSTPRPTAAPPPVANPFMPPWRQMPTSRGETT